MNGNPSTLKVKSNSHHHPSMSSGMENEHNQLNVDFKL